jgi:hypothetical protein
VRGPGQLELQQDRQGSRSVAGGDEGVGDKEK